VSKVAFNNRNRGLSHVDPGTCLQFFGISAFLCHKKTIIPVPFTLISFHIKHRFDKSNNFLVGTILLFSCYELHDSKILSKHFKLKLIPEAKNSRSAHALLTIGEYPSRSKFYWNGHLTINTGQQNLMFKTHSCRSFWGLLQLSAWGLFPKVYHFVIASYLKFQKC